MKMIPRFTVTLLLFSASIANSQTKLLSIQEAILKGRSSLAPKRLSNTTFIPGTKKFSFTDNNVLQVLNAETGKPTFSLSVLDFNKELKAAAKDTVASFEGIKWADATSFYFQNKVGELKY